MLVVTTRRNGALFFWFFGLFKRLTATLLADFQSEISQLAERPAPEANTQQAESAEDLTKATSSGVYGIVAAFAVLAVQQFLTADAPTTSGLDQAMDLLK